MLDSVVQLITVLFIFIFVLALAYFATKLTATVQKGGFQNANLEILETFKIAPNKYIQVVRIGGKYFAYVVCKENATLLGELEESDAAGFFKKKDENAAVKSFHEIFEKLKK